MSVTIAISDQANARPPKDALVLDWREGVPLTVRDLIRERVRLEYESREDPRREGMQPLVRLPEAPAETVEHIVQRALSGFEANAFLVLVGERQAESLDETIRLTPKTEVTFLRLLPLVGG